jgi:hypothetical protein
MSGSIGRWLSAAVAVGVVLAAGARPAAAQAGARYALVIQGAAGDEQYGELHRGWLNTLVGLMRDRFKYDAAHLTVLADQAQAGEQRSTAENVRAALGAMATAMTPADQLIVVLIGHGGGDGADAKFNLVGADLNVAQWKALLDPIKGRVAVVDTTSASFAYLAGLTAPGRVVITATSTYSQKYHTMFPDYFIKALTTSTADLDKDGRISLLEAFTFASGGVKQYYEQKGTMATETAVIDDDGDGKGRDAAATGPDGAIAAVTYFEAPNVPTSTNPEIQRLLARQRELTEQMDDLRRRRGFMTQQDFDAQFEKLALELAEVSAEVRKRTAN